MNNISQYEENGFFTIKSFFTKKHMDKVRESLNKIADIFGLELDLEIP
jgi:hypothetical protein